jgi:hypothetical protein
MFTLIKLNIYICEIGLSQRVADNLWVLGDEVERSVPFDLDFAPWPEDNSDDLRTGSGRGHHGWTDGSRRESAAFRWSLRGYRVNPLNWFTTRDALVNTKLRLMARRRQLLISWNL